MCALALSGALLVAGCASAVPDPIVAMPSGSPAVTEKPAYPLLEIGKYPYSSTQLVSLGQLPHQWPDARKVMSVTKLKGISPAERAAQEASVGYQEARWTYGAREAVSSLIPQVSLLSGDWVAAREDLVQAWGEPYRQSPQSVQFVKQGAGALVLLSDDGMGVGGACLVPSWAAEPIGAAAISPSAGATPQETSAQPTLAASSTAAATPTGQASREVPSDTPLRALTPGEEASLDCALAMAKEAARSFDPGGRRAVDRPGSGKKPKAPKEQGAAKEGKP